MIERKPGGEPLYSQISDLIKADLEKLRYGDRVPSEAELMEKYKVSRGTVIQAISSLVNAGFLYRIQGKGTFRGNGPINDMHVQNLLPSFSNTLLMAGKVPAISGKKLSSVPADSEISAALSVAVGDEVWKMERLRGEMGRDPICYATAYIPKSIILDL